MSIATLRLQHLARKDAHFHVRSAARALLKAQARCAVHGSCWTTAGPETYLHTRALRGKRAVLQLRGSSQARARSLKLCCQLVHLQRHGRRTFGCCMFL